jgi:hypothetical protein
MVANKSGKGSSPGLGNEIIDCVSGLPVINKFPFNPFEQGEDDPAK